MKTNESMILDLEQELSSERTMREGAQKEVAYLNRMLDTQTKLLDYAQHLNENVQKIAMNDTQTLGDVKRLVVTQSDNLSSIREQLNEFARQRSEDEGKESSAESSNYAMTSQSLQDFETRIGVMHNEMIDRIAAMAQPIAQQVAPATIPDRWKLQVLTRDGNAKVKEVRIVADT